jgi:hypothetical protein
MRRTWMCLMGVFVALTLGYANALADDFGDSPLAAAPLAIGGGPLSGCIETPGDTDYFLFTAVAGRTYRLITTHLSTGMDTLLYLFDSDGRSILAVDDNSGADGGSQIDWTAQRDGVYFVMVRHAQATSGTGCYAVSITMLQVDDHGNDALSATPLTVGGAARPGFLEQSSDVDFFLFQAERGYAYVINVTRTTEGGTIRARLLAEDGARELGSVTIGSDVGQIEWTAPSAGIRFLEISSSAGDSVVGYEVSVAQAGYGDDFGNSAAAAANLAGLGPVISGAVEVAGDQDWFQFDAKQNGEYNITLTPTDGAVLHLTLVGADGTLLVDRAAAAAGTALAIDWVAPNEGTYYLEVSSANGVGSYALRLDTTLELQLLGRLNPQGYSLDVRASGTLAYLVVGTKGLLLVDVSDPAHPVEIGSNSTRGYAQSVAVSGSLAYVANRGDGLTILNVSDPMRPVEAGRLDTSGSAEAVALRGQLAVVADQRGGLQLVDVSKPGSPTLVKTVETSGFAQAVSIDGGLAYVAAGDAGLEIVNIATPSSAATVSRLSLQGEANDVVVSAGIAYVAAGYRGVRIVDVSNPAAPVEIGFLSTAGEALGLAVRSSTLYVAEGSGGLTVYDVSNPRDAKRMAQIDTPGEALHVAVDGDRAYIACREAGLAIIQLLP